MYFLSAFIITLLSFTYLPIHVLIVAKLAVGLGERGFTLYVHCLSSRVRKGTKVRFSANKPGLRVGVSFVLRFLLEFLLIY